MMTTVLPAASAPTGAAHRPAPRSQGDSFAETLAAVSRDHREPDRPAGRTSERPGDATTPAADRPSGAGTPAPANGSAEGTPAAESGTPATAALPTTEADDAAVTGVAPPATDADTAPTIPGDGAEVPAEGGTPEETEAHVAPTASGAATGTDRPTAGTPTATTPVPTEATAATATSGTAAAAPGTAATMPGTAATAPGSAPEGTGGTTAQAGAVQGTVPQPAVTAEAETAVAAAPRVTEPPAPEQRQAAPELAVRGLEGTSGQLRSETVARVEAPPAPAAPAPQPPPLGSQLAASLSRLKTAPEGHHVLNIRVDPEDLGPVRVTAHIGTDGVRIELFGITDTARDALRGALTELRRELAASGFAADLDLGSEEGTAQQQRRSEQPARTPFGQPPATATPPAPRPAPSGGHGLDLLA